VTGAAAGGPLVAVAADKFAPGVKTVADDWRGPNARKVTAAYEVLDLEEALAWHYATDAHLVGYLVRGADGRSLDRQPRVNKEGLEAVRALGFTVDVGLLFCDADNPGHAAWTPERLEAALAQWDAWAGVEGLSSLGFYLTAHGSRFVQVLDAPVSPDEAEGLLRGLHARLQAEGVAVDPSCKDWTRHFRLPHVTRKGRFSRSPFVDLRRMQPARLAPHVLPAEPAAGERKVARAVRSRPPAPEAPPLGPLGPAWQPVVDRVAAAVRAEPARWHDLFLAFAGALLEHGVDAKEVVTLCVAVSLATGADTKTADRRRAAESTVARAAAGGRLRGTAALRAGWPAVGYALDRALDDVRAPGMPPRLSAAPAPDEAAVTPLSSTPSPEEAAAQVEQAIRSAGPGLTVLQAPCGLGKTRAAERVALERARKPYASPDAKGERVPLGSKTVFAFDKNALCLESYARLRAAGAPVERRFGALAKLDAQGRPACAHAAAALPLVAGQQSLAREFCEGRGLRRCEFYDGCEARLRCEGDEGARVVVGPHALLGELDEAAGATGLLVIDEPPPPLTTLSFELGAIEDALKVLSSDFERPYGDIVRPLLVALAAAVRAAPPKDGPLLRPDEALAVLAPHAPPGLLATACRAADVERTGDGALDLGRAFAAAIHPDRPSQAPPLAFYTVPRAMRRQGHADRVGAASGLLAALHRLFAEPAAGFLRLRRQGTSTRALLTLPHPDLARALRRDGAVVVLDANADVNLPVYEQIVGYAPRYVRLATPPDGAPVERRHAPAHAKRRRWMKDRRLAPTPELGSAVRLVFDWALEGPSDGALALITFRPLALALRAALRPSDPEPAEQWANEGRLRADLEALVDGLGRELARWSGELLIGHYGGVRGLDVMKHADALVTLGDPWPNIDDVASEVAFLGLRGSWEARAEALCRAELEQAHGRLRTIHRTRPARALHVGMVLPGGVAWEAVGRTAPRAGRPKTKAALDATSFREQVRALGGVGAAARTLGCSLAAVKRYVYGERAVPAEVTERCVLALASQR
jgi:hypothetical protein